MNGSTGRVLMAVALAAAGAALFAGGVQAADRPDDRAGMTGVGAVSAAAPPDVVERWVQRRVDPANWDATVPDAVDRAVLGARADVVRPDDRGEVRRPGFYATVSRPSESTAQDSGVAWGDAALAAAGTFGVILLGGLTTLTIRHRRRVAVR